MEEGETESGPAALQGFCFLKGPLTSLSKMVRRVHDEKSVIGGGYTGWGFTVMALAGLEGCVRVLWVLGAKDPNDPNESHCLSNDSCNQGPFKRSHGFTETTHFRNRHPPQKNVFTGSRIRKTFRLHESTGSTENDVVLSSAMWRRQFTSWRRKKMKKT